MRAFEFCPYEFKCFTYADDIHNTLMELDLKFKYRDSSYIIEAIKSLVRAFRIAVPGCETFA